MRAILLVGGFGTRLKPLTNTRPKQMLPIAGRPMIEWVVEHLAQHGIDEVILSLGYRPDAFEAAYPNGTCSGVDVRFVVEDEPLGTAGAIAFAASEAGIDETFLVLNADVLTDLDVSALISFHKSSGAEATLNLTRVDDPSRFGVVPTNDEGRVTRFVEKPAPGEAPTNFVNAGTYVVEPAMLKRIPSGRMVSVERETFVAMAKEGCLSASQSPSYWIDTGTPETFLQANYDLLDGLREVLLENNVLQGDIHDSAVLKRSVVGADSLVKAGATVLDSVLFRSVVVGEGARIEGSILGEHVRVGEGAVIESGSVIGDGVEIPAREVVTGRKIPDQT